ncbi:acyltransferase [Defluviimonas aestuarii]|uniref:acyltransferase family protein n=1 Tax=Albidovulum aestuarii TaxID=1130726 RepID=UPI002499FB56|nr:acyltransferase [Defluviimonas aestuarii]MDI3335251.1 acyltransferase [Defluviimonas aestuarii]
MLIGVQYLRAVAASLVVVSHITYLVPGGKWHFNGNFGVDIFFLISGFVIWVSGAKIPAGAFALRRIIRIVPIYWMVTLYASLVDVRNGLEFGFWPETEDFLRSLLFIPYQNAERGGDISPILGVGWSLNLEMYFYALFTVGIFVARKHLLAFVVCILCLVPVLVNLGGTTDIIFAFYSRNITLEFAGGMILGATYVSRGQLGGPIHGATALFIAFALLAFAPSVGFRAIDSGVPAALILIAVIALEPLFRIRPQRWGVLLGDSSYSLYLLHGQVLFFFGPLVSMGLLPRIGWVTRPLAFVACVLTAIALHLMFEKPATRLLRHMLARWKRNGDGTEARDRA